MVLLRFWGGDVWDFKWYFSMFPIAAILPGLRSLQPVLATSKCCLKSDPTEEEERRRIKE
jgi:hypothetical protein